MTPCPCQSSVRASECQGRQPPGRSVLRRRSFTYSYSYLLIFITYSLFLFPDIDRYTDDNTLFFFFFFFFFSSLSLCVLYYVIMLEYVNSEYGCTRARPQIKKWRVAAAERLRNAKKWCVGLCGHIS